MSAGCTQRDLSNSVFYVDVVQTINNHSLRLVFYWSEDLGHN